MKKVYNEELKRIYNENLSFMKYMHEAWQELLDYSFLLYDKSVQVTNYFIQNIDLKYESKINLHQYKFLALHLISCNALRTYKAICFLIENGFSDEAYALSRRLFEAYVISKFIHQSDEKLAKNFINHSASDKDYSWAKNYGANSFSDIFRKINNNINVVDMKPLYNDFYKKACKYLHLSPLGVKTTLSIPNYNWKSGPCLWGQSDSGIDIPSFWASTILVYQLKFYFDLFQDDELSNLIAELEYINKKIIDIVAPEGITFVDA